MSNLVIEKLSGIKSFLFALRTTFLPNSDKATPKKLSLKIVILKPLYSFGLCEPVIIIFASNLPQNTLK